MPYDSYRYTLSGCNNSYGRSENECCKLRVVLLPRDGREPDAAHDPIVVRFVEDSLPLDPFISPSLFFFLLPVAAESAAGSCAVLRRVCDSDSREARPTHTKPGSL